MSRKAEHAPRVTSEVNNAILYMTAMHLSFVNAPFGSFAVERTTLESLPSFDSMLAEDKMRNVSMPLMPQKHDIPR